MSFAKFLLKGTARLALVGFTIKVISDTNAFSTNSKETEQKFQQLVTELVPGTIELKDKLIVTKDDVRDGYNKTVDGVFTAINYLPATFSNFARSIQLTPVVGDKKDN